MSGDQGQSQPFMDASSIPVVPAGSAQPQTPAPGYTPPPRRVVATLYFHVEADIWGEIRQLADVEASRFFGITPYELTVSISEKTEATKNGYGEEIIPGHYIADVTAKVYDR